LKIAAGGDGDVLLAIHLVGDRRSVHAGTEVIGPNTLAGVALKASNPPSPSPMNTGSEQYTRIGPRRRGHSNHQLSVAFMKTYQSRSTLWLTSF
jgi:hypothetical protein